MLRQVKKSLKANPNFSKKSSKSKTSLKKNEPALYITEKQGKRFLVINPDSPLIQGFANVDDQFTSFQIPSYNSGAAFYNINGLPSMQVPTIPSFGASAGLFPSTFGGSPYPGMKINGFPFLGGQTDSGGLFRGFIAVPITTQFPLTPLSGYRGFGQSPSAFPFFTRNSFPLNNGFYGNPLPTDEPGYHSNYFHPPIYGGRRSMDFDGGQDVAMDRYHEQNININDQGELVDQRFYENNHADDNHFSSIIGGDFGERSNFERPGPRDGDFPHFNSAPGENFGERPSPRNGNFPHFNPVPGENFGERSNFEGSDPRGGNFPNHFSSMFGGTFSEKSDFEKPISGVENFPDFERNNEVFKRSREQSYPIKPYVFTKEHVGFGPITVEAHTASYKGEDPKDDDK